MSIDAVVLIDRVAVLALAGGGVSGAVIVPVLALVDGKGEAGGSCPAAIAP